MANHKSAQKRANQNEIKRLRNRIIKTKVKHAITDFKLALNEGKYEEIVKMLNMVKSTIDIAKKKGVIHSKTASRKISRLSKLSNL